MIALPPSQFDQTGCGVKEFADVLKSSAEIGAILVGGFWTYINYFRGRTHRSRLECKVDGSIIQHAPRSLLKVVAKIRNVGLARVSIQKEGTALHIRSALTPNASPQVPCQAIWNEEPAVFDVFKDHTDIEPSEPIEDHVLVELPGAEASAYRLTLTVCSKKGLLKKGQIWTATSILETVQEK